MLSILNRLLQLKETFKDVHDPAAEVENKWLKWGLRLVFATSIILTLHFSSDRLVTKPAPPSIEQVATTNSYTSGISTNTTPRQSILTTTAATDHKIQTLELVTYLSTLLGALAGVWTYMVKPIYTTASRIKKMVADVSYVTEQLRPNGGGSTYDTIKKTSLAVNAHTDQIGQLATSLNQVHDVVTIATSKSHMVFDENHLAMFECDPSGSCIWTNKALQNLFGMSSTDLLGSGWLAALHPDDIHRVYDNWQDTIKKGIPYRVDYRVVNVKTKQETFVEATAKVIRKEAQGQVLSLIGTITIL